MSGAIRWRIGEAAHLFCIYETGLAIGFAAVYTEYNVNVFDYQYSSRIIHSFGDGLRERARARALVSTRFVLVTYVSALFELGTVVFVYHYLVGITLLWKNKKRKNRLLH